MCLINDIFGCGSLSLSQNVSTFMAIVNSVSLLNGDNNLSGWSNYSRKLFQVDNSNIFHYNADNHRKQYWFSTTKRTHQRQEASVFTWKFLNLLIFSYKLDVSEVHWWGGLRLHPIKSDHRRSTWGFSFTVTSSQSMHSTLFSSWIMLSELGNTDPKV